MSTRDERIAPTAHYTAYAWRWLGMPHARHFATLEGAAMFWGFRATLEWIAVLTPGLPSMAQYLELRHRLLDWELTTYEPDRVVELGAGLSRRGLTFALERGVRYLEVDLAPMSSAKRARLEALPSALRARLGERLSLHTHDVLGESFAPWLAQQLAGSARPAVVAEGLLGYFEEPERERIVRAVATSLRESGGGRLLCDLRSREGGAPVAAAARVLRAGIKLATRGRGAAGDFASHDAIRAFFARAGFDEAAPVEVEPVLPHLAHLRTPGRIWRATVSPRAL